MSSQQNPNTQYYPYYICYDKSLQGSHQGKLATVCIGFSKWTEEVKKLHKIVGDYIVESGSHIDTKGNLNIKGLYGGNTFYKSHLEYDDIIDINDEGFKK